ncbi:hypothetical protein K1719_044873 [Acacia pycnantha]|nr:hypothetical protein K1719_044873 [Acacia pycnantha]
MTKASSIGQRSRFAAIGNLEDDVLLTSAEAIDTPNVEGQLQDPVAIQSLSQKTNKRERANSAKLSTQAKKKEPSGNAHGQKFELGQKIKPTYKLKEAKSTSLGPKVNAESDGPANSLAIVGQCDSDKMVSPMHECNIIAPNEVVPQMGNKKAHDKLGNGHRTHIIVHGNLNSKSQQGPKASSVNTMATHKDQISGDLSMEPNQGASQLNNLRPPEHWDPNDDVAPDFLEANGSFVAETRFERQHEGGTGDPDKISRNFLWSQEEEVKKMHLIAWDKITKAKKQGGLGFKNLRRQNKAFIMKICWNLLTNKDTLWARCIWSKYNCGQAHVPNVSKKRNSSSHLLYPRPFFG